MLEGESSESLPSEWLAVLNRPADGNAQVVTITGHVRKHKEQTGAVLRRHGHLVENILVVLDSTRPVILHELQLCSVLCENVRTLNVLPPAKRGRGQGRGRRGGANGNLGQADESRSVQEMLQLLQAFAPAVEMLNFKVFEPFRTSIVGLGAFLAKAPRLRTLVLGVRSDEQLRQHEADLLVENLKCGGGAVRDLTLAPKAIHALADSTIADFDLVNLTHLRLTHDGVTSNRLRKVLVRFSDRLEFVAFTGNGVDYDEHYPNVMRIQFPRLETVEYWRNQKNKILHRLIDSRSPVKTFLIADEQSGTLDEVKSFVAHQRVPTVDRVFIKCGKPKTSRLQMVWINGTTPYKNTVRQYERWGRDARVAVFEGW